MFFLCALFIVLVILAVLIGSVHVNLLDIGMILANHLFGSGYALTGQ